MTVPTPDPDEQLARVLAHLERFSRVLAHDLKAPLANVSSFAQLLPTVADLDEQAAMMADRMAVNARRAAAMVDAVLDHARRIGRTVTEPVEVDLNVVMDEVAQSVAELADEADADLGWGELPTVAGDPEAITALLRRVVDNAIRYRRPEEPVEVRVEATTVGGWVDLTVIDNGPGVAADKQAAAFELGTRLVDVAGPVLGSGVGLATARLIAENHGGTIDFGPPPTGGGAAVHVRLPAARGDSPSAP